MITAKLTALALATLLSSAAFAATATGTGPTNPVDGPKTPALQGTPGMNTNGNGADMNNSLPATGTDPRTQSNDPGRQGGMNTPGSTPDNAGPGVGSKTTTGGSGSEGGGASQ